jgi:hypothetical protein
MPDLATLPRQAAPMADLDASSFEAYRLAQRRTRGFAFPEAELRHGFAARPDGSIGESLLSPTIRRAITIDARLKPDYTYPYAGAGDLPSAALVRRGHPGLRDPQ